ncbi:hypothetical protein [Kitasatospora camelliae]|uniref:Secreted protein n=1 Tax=Kitasatospora camelliae TaxID=3156397 RepID=A0AAU8K8X0_9ACTN
MRLRKTGIGMAVVAAVLAAGVTAGAPAVAEGEPTGGPAEGEVLPHPGPDGLIWIPAWVGHGGAVTGGASPDRSFTLTVACQGIGSVEVTFTAQYGDTSPVTFQVDCTATGAPGVGSRVLDGEQGRSFGVGVTTSSPAIRWGLTATQAD